MVLGGKTLGDFERTPAQLHDSLRVVDDRAVVMGARLLRRRRRFGRGAEMIDDEGGARPLERHLERVEELRTRNGRPFRLAADIFSSSPRRLTIRRFGLAPMTGGGGGGGQHRIQIEATDEYQKTSDQPTGASRQHPFVKLLWKKIYLFFCAKMIKYRLMQK